MNIFRNIFQGLRISCLGILFVVLGFTATAFAKQNLKEQVQIWSERFSLIEPISLDEIEKNSSAGLSFLSDYSLFSLLDSLQEKQRTFLFDRLGKLEQEYGSSKEESDSVYKKSEDYNLVIVLYDLVAPEQDNYSYVEVYIDKKRRGITSKTLASQKKILKLKVQEGVQHLLELSKFVSSKQNNRNLQRLKNLLQPKAKYFTVPKDRIRVIQIIYDASKENPAQSHLKYRYVTHFLQKNESIE